MNTRRKHLMMLLLLGGCGPGRAADSGTDEIAESTATTESDSESGSTGDGESDSSDMETGDDESDSSDTETGDDESDSSDTSDNDLVAVAVHSGGLRNCALRSDGRVKCWGTSWLGGSHGGVGYGDTPADIDFVDIGFEVASLSMGHHGSTCVVSTEGALRCWGSNELGKLGYGTYGHDESVGGPGFPTPAEAGDVDVGGKVFAVAAGGSHTCAILEDQTLRCWGGRGEGGVSSGQLGYGNTEPIGDDEFPSAAGPVPVGGPVSAVTAGSTHTCAILENGAVRCWGRNTHGQLGYGHTDSIGDDETPSRPAMCRCPVQPSPSMPATPTPVQSWRVAH
jgi:alpha-tubulin suppressor-like RCC1 family protein